MAKSKFPSLIRRSKTNSEPLARRFVRALMWLHITFLIMLPLAGHFLLRGKSGTLNLVGWLPAVIFVLLVVISYRITVRPTKALFIVLLVPLQVGLHVYGTGGSVGMFFLEEAFIEVTSICAALAIAMLLYRPSGAGGAALGLLLAAIPIVGFGGEVLRKYTYGRYDWWWWMLLGVCLLSATWAHFRMVQPLAKGDGDGDVPEDGYRHGTSSFADRFMGKDEEYVKPNVPESVQPAIIIIYIVFWFIVTAVAPKFKVLL